MEFLLDTNVFIWTAEGYTNLSKKAEEIFLDPNNDLFLSVISIWEIITKEQIHKLKLPEDPEIFVKNHCSDNGIKILPLGMESAFALKKLPLIHKDPFDRLIISQALTNNLRLMTPDSFIHKYKVEAVW